jgi:protein NrfD
VILFLFLSHLGVGIVLSLLLVSREAGVKFFRFNAGLAAILVAVALAFRPSDSPSRVDQLSFVALLVGEGALLLYWATVGRSLASVRPLILGLACVGGLVALVGQAVAIASSWGPTLLTLTVTSFVASALFLGGACTAMVLGHWYLVIPSMQVRHLQSIVKFHLLSIALRVVVVAAAVAVGFMAIPPETGPSFDRYIFSIDGIFFWQRVLFGLAGPAVLAYLTWETAKIQSTQSATGILYVDFFTVVVGEVLAKYLLLATRVPV